MGFQSRPVVNFAVRQSERLPGLLELTCCPLPLQRGALLSPFFLIRNAFGGVFG